MAKQIINVGQAANDGSGDPLRNAFIKTNDNFTELYDSIDVQDLDFQGDSGNGSIELDSQTFSLVGTNGVVTSASGQTITIDTSSLETRLTTAEADIDTNTANITTEISDRTSADTTLQSNIDAEAATRLANDNTLQGNIDTEEASRISGDANLQSQLDSNDTDISGLDTRLTTAEGNISSNDTDIATNASDIATNASDIDAIETKTDFITVTQAVDLDTMESGISSNASNIATNTSNISSNDTDIATNAANIATNVTDIATNATNISSNDTDITALQNDKYDKTGGTISGSVTISDDLTVNGTTTTVNTETLSVEDPLIEMANQNAANSVDTGFYAKYSLDAGTTTKYAGLFKDASDSDTFKLFRGLEVEPTTTINTGGTGYALADLDVAGLSASSGTISGDLIVDTNTLYVDSADNRVGIGTITPVSTFHLKSDFTDANSTSQLLVENESSGENVVIALKGVASGGQGGNQGSITFNAGADGTAANNVLGFNADQQDNAGSPDMVILGNGRMGIGTDSPSTELQVKGSAEIFRIDDSSSTGSPFMTFFQDGTRRSLIQHLDSGDLLSLVSEYGGIRFMTGTGGTEVERMRIHSGGDISFRDTSANEAFYWDASASRLGIGTASPSDDLHISGTTASIRLQDSDGTNTFGRLRYTGSSVYFTSRNNTSNGNFIFIGNNGTSDTEYMRIDSGGDISFRDTSANQAFYWDASAASLGIGTTSPSELLHIHSGNSGGTANNAADEVLVEGSGDTGITISSPSTNSGTLAFGDESVSFRGAVSYNHSDDSMNFRVSSNTRMTIDSSGNVGIGTDSPSVELEIASGAPQIRLTDTDGGYCEVANVSGHLLLQADKGNTQSSSYMRFDVDGSERMRIDSSGNVGIGTDSPNEKLHVDGGTTNVVANFESTDAKAYISFKDSSTTNTDTVFLGAEGNDMTFYAGSASSERMRIDSSGRVGIGVTPSADLHIRKQSDGSEASSHFKIEGGTSLYSAHHWLDTNAYYIGQSSVSRKLRIYSGAETSGVNLSSGATSWGTFSDERLKYDIEPVENAVESLSNLRTVKYRLKDVDSTEDNKKIGVIAQDLVGVLDEVIDPVKKRGDDTEYMSVKYTELVPVLIKAIQELKAEIETLKSQIQ